MKKKFAAIANSQRLSFKIRIYIPVHLNGQVVTWQCRGITGKSALRYLGQSHDKEILTSDDADAFMRLALGRASGY